MPRIRITRNTKWFSVHTHSKFSAKDALPAVKDIVARASELGYRGLALTDHGNIAGSVELYQECKKVGIKPFPGSELYLVKDRSDKKAKRYHVGVLAYTTEGYRNLVHLSTLTHEHFYHKPLIDLADMAELHQQGKTKGLALTTGCYFGLVIQTLIHDGYMAAKQLVATFAGWFDTYVEVQAHCIDHGEGVPDELLIARLLARIARELGLPLVVTQDSHYVAQEEREVHENLKALVSFGPDPDDAVFPGDGFHLADEEWVRSHHDPEIFERGLAGLEVLLAKWDIAIPEMDHYDYRVPDVGNVVEVKRRVIRECIKRGLGRAYRQQIDLEFEIIDVARMWGYLGLVTRVCDHMREVNMFFQIRGSAGGSLVCWLLGITNVDPLKWKLRMDRFLSKDRTKPPDIDIDVESDRRQELIDWIAGEYALVQIGTWGTLSIDKQEDGGGSLSEMYFGVMRRMGTPVKHIDADDREDLIRLSDMEVYSNIGKHAAGLVITTNRVELRSQVPMAWIASSQTMVSQYDGPTIESLGLVKLDVLGVKNLSVLRQCLLNLGRDPAEGLDWIPLRDPSVMRMLSKGLTAGVFQLEGKTSAREVKRLKPTTIKDVIAAMALFRPGVMRSGGMTDYIERKHGESEVPGRHPILAAATGDTYGVMLYQDSVIEVLRNIGLSQEELNAMLKAVKASNKNVAQAKVTMEKHKAEVYRLSKEAGMEEGEVDWLWGAIEGFSDYSFNRSHATIYGITAWRCAYLSYHHPLEFHAALLAVASGSDKERGYQIATRARRIRLLKPDVNSAGATYKVDPKGQGIRRGLTSIKSIGPATARKIEEQQPFTSIEDFCDRVNISGVKDWHNDKTYDTGSLKVLAEAGALTPLGVTQDG